MRRSILAAGMFLMILAVQAKDAGSVIQNGRSDYRIAVPENKSPAVEYAARELQSFLKQMTGVTLPIIPETELRDGPAFLLGPCRRNREAGLVEEAAKLRPDGVLIKASGNSIALLGQNERGNLYSVYVLLEKYLGVRFFAWDCTVVPRRTVLTLSDTSYSYSPPFMYRETLYFDSFPKEIAARQRLNGPFTKCDASVGGKISFYPYVHSFSELFPPDTYYKEHPEYYGLQGGKRVAGKVHAQLCLTNPDVLRLAKEKVLKWIDEHPDVPIFDVSQNDGNGACECENCTRIVNEEGSQHGPILRFVNAIAAEVAAKHPDKWIETLAYAYSTKPPAITKPRDNVIIRLCHAGCYFHGFEQCGLGSNLASYIEQWRKLTGHIFIWHYATNFAHYLAPNQNLQGLAKDIACYAAHGVNGLMVQCDYQGPGGELAELRQYLAAQLMWDPAQDPMKIRTEFCTAYYGKAAKDVLEFLQTTDRVSETTDVHAFGAWDPQKTVSPQFVEESLRILERGKAASNDRAVRNRIAKLMLPFWYMKLTWPARYGLPDKEAPAMWRQTRQVLTANRITHVREGESNAAEWIAEMDARFAPRPKDLVFDLMQIGKARTENCADWRVSHVERGGRSLPTVFQHPDGKHDGDATYEISLPSAGKKKLLFSFATVITNKSTDGVRFAVLVDDKELWNETKTVFLSPDQVSPKAAQDSILPGRDPFSDHVIDLSAYAGRTIRLTLRVNALANDSYDWANWVAPRITVSK